MARKPAKKPPGNVKPVGRPGARRGARADVATIVGAETTAQIFMLRRHGWSLRDIGEQVKLSHMAVSNIITESIAAYTRDSVASYIALECIRLDELQTAFYEGATSGDAMAVDKVLAIMAHRARLLGLYAPEKVEEVGEVANAKSALLAKLNQAADRVRLACEARAERDALLTIDAVPVTETET